MRIFFRILAYFMILAAMIGGTEHLWRRTGYLDREARTRSGRPLRYLDRETGYRLLPNLTDVTEVREVSGTAIWSTTFSTDEKGRRVVPGQAGRGAKLFAAFFGGTFVFGEGLGDHQTLPYHFSLRQPEWKAYNYADSGYGPHQMLARLKDVQIKNEIIEERGVGVYVFTGDQIRISAGSMRSRQDAPAYELSNAALTRKGLFQDTHPVKSWLFGLFESLALYRRFGPDWPPRITESDTELFCALINASSRQFKSHFKKSPFVVLILRDFPQDGSKSDPGMFQDIRPCLDRMNIAYFDYYERLDDPVRFMLPDGNHPNDFASQYISSLLSQDLAPLVLPP